MRQAQEDSDTGAMDVAEHRAKPKLNETLSPAEKEEILLPSVLNEGHAVIDPVLQLGMSIVEKSGGTLECFDSQFNRAVSRDGGRTWGEYQVMGGMGEARMVAGCFRGGFGWIRLPSGKIGVGWEESGSVAGGHRFARLWWRTSDDEGESWSEPVLINPTGEMGRPSHLSPMRLTSSARLLLPVRWTFNAGDRIHDNIQLGEGWWKGRKVSIEGHNHYPEMDITYVYYSDDEGLTWSRCEGEVLGWPRRGWLNTVPTDEPSLDELKDGRLLMLMRSTIGRLLQSCSEDGGEHWSVTEPSPLASSYSPCCLKRIPRTGDLLCVWNQASSDEIRGGHQRGRLSAAITSDGRTWHHFRTLERFGRLSDVDRVEPDESLLACRCLDDIGDIPEDRGLADYATVAFHEDDVILNYPVVRGVAQDLVSAMKVRVLPLDWFYAAP